jgi:hypothetical protein
VQSGARWWNQLQKTMLGRYLFLALAFAVAAPRGMPASEPIYNEKADAANDMRAASHER